MLACCYNRRMSQNSPLPKLITQLNELVALPSVSSTNPRIDLSNKPVIDRLASWLEELGFACEIMAVPDHPGKYNLIATLGSGPGGLVLAGHTDTVPFDGHLWQQDPLKLTERDGRFYGLGSADMKGFFPIAIEAARTFIDQPLQQPLIILATADGRIFDERRPGAGRSRLPQSPLRSCGRAHQHAPHSYA